MTWSAPAWRWRRVAVNASGQGQGILAVAVEPRPGARVAIGDLEGVSLATAAGRFRFAARVPGVTDLAFGAGGALWIASADGLWRLSPEGQLSDRSPSPGEAARVIRRVLVLEGLVVAATEVGAWVSRDERTWTRLADGLPRAPIAAAAGRADGLWLLVGRELWRTTLVVDGSGLRLREARRVPIQSAPTSELPVDLTTEIPGAEIAVLYPRALAVRVGPQSPFRMLRPVLPPGAVASRIRPGAERVWIATDQGLVGAPGFAGPWRRAEAPAGSEPARGLATTPERDGLLVAGPSGLLRGAPVLLAQADPAGGPPEVALVPLPRDPDIRAVQAASLQYLDLGPGRMRALRAGLSKRGWLPVLSVRLAAARDKRWGEDHDQSFLSGDTRFLVDRDEDKALDLEASLVMTWDLGQLAFDEDAIDISREHRLIVSLRDNVLDEINQLYFERRGLLEQLRAGRADADVQGISLRAAELGAGLDAWTGGWFSATSTHPSHGLDPEERP